MQVYYADIRGLDEKDALYPPLSKRKGSAFGVSLLAAAYADYAGKPVPKLLSQLTGRPSGSPAFHYSISHSKTHVLCALSSGPVGVDTEARRPFKQAYIERLCTPAELAGLSFFEIWVLRESFFKLTGSGSPREPKFYKRKGKIVSPRPGVFLRLYPDIEGSARAVAALEDKFPDSIKKIPAEALLKKDAAKRLRQEKKAKKQAE